ncbi:thrombospondin [Francisella tularensis]|uniref:thrombospondin n=1 Tax=Francisella tularensis TaxID=263 RepID=UPI0002F8D13B|nr:thrombospondin [Francisella tularensis]
MFKAVSYSLCFLLISFIYYSDSSSNLNSQLITIVTDGFDALADLDSNNDGVFDSADEAFDSVQVWQDKDQDGVTDAGELTSLAEAGISSIDLNAKTVNQSVAGGILRKTSTATNIDGSTTTVGAMDFAENKFYSKFEEVLQSSQDLQNSINVAGQGALRSLHESASLSPVLKNSPSSVEGVDCEARRGSTL